MAAACTPTRKFCRMAKLVPLGLNLTHCMRQIHLRAAFRRRRCRGSIQRIEPRQSAFGRPKNPEVFRLGRRNAHPIPAPPAMHRRSRLCIARIPQNFRRRPRSPGGSILNAAAPTQRAPSLPLRRLYGILMILQKMGGWFARHRSSIRREPFCPT